MSHRDDEVDAWRGNATVQTLTFTKETCLHLILLLAKSTNTIAPSLRDMNGFKVLGNTSSIEVTLHSGCLHSSMKLTPCLYPVGGGGGGGGVVGMGEGAGWRGRWRTLARILVLPF